MLNLLLLFIILKIFSIFFSIILKKKIEFTYIITIMSIITLLYIFGLFGYLKIGVYFIQIISLIIMLYDLNFLSKNKFFIKKYILTKGLFLFTFLFISLTFIHQGRLLSSWDEFSHWGDVVKAMFTIDDFSTSPLSMSTFQSYPPAMSLFQYFCLKLGNNFIESQLFITYQLVGICLFLPFLSNIKKNKNLIISLLLLLIMPMIIFNTYYVTIYIDAILGLFFGYIILSIIYNEDYDMYFYINIVLSLFILILLKDVGLFLAIISIVSLLVDLLLVKKKISFTKKFFNENKKYLFLIFSSIIAIIIAKLSWNLNINYNGANISFANKISLKNIVDLFMFKNLGYRESVVKNFISALYNKNIIASFINIDTIRLTIIFALTFLLALKNNKNSHKYIYTIFAGFLIYVIGLLIIYCFKFSEYEAINLASYNRYMSIYFVAIFFIACVILINNQKHLTSILLIVLLFVPYFNIFTIRNSVDDSIAIRKNYDVATTKIKNNTENNDKIYVISQNTTGFDYWVIRFSVRPNQINSGAWSIGNKYYEKDIWTLQINAEKWYYNLINDNYDYVYIYKCDENFVTQFSSLFEDTEQIKNNSLYRIGEKLILVE